MSLVKPVASLLAFSLLSIVASTGQADAAVILTFGQTAPDNMITGTNNGAGSTTISGTNVPIEVTQILGGGTPMAFLTLNAQSTAPAMLSAGNVIQTYAVAFAITSGLGGTGTNYLSGTINDAVFGAMGGPSLSLSAAQPPAAVTLTSNIIAANNLFLARGMALSFANVTPLVGITNNSLSSFSSSVAGTFSANAAVVPEPMSFLLLGSGLMAVAVRACRQKSRRHNRT